MKNINNLQLQYVNKEYYTQTIYLLSELDKHSHEIFEHSIDVYNLSVRLGKELNLSDAVLHSLCTAALLHDIGKLSIPVDILESPSLTHAQKQFVRLTHVKETTRLLLQYGFSQDIVDIASHHHEKANGSGYPNGLKGKDVSFVDQVLVVADHTSAILMDRAYKKGKTKEQCIEILDNMASDHQVDSKITNCMVNILNTCDMTWSNHNEYSMNI